MQRSNYNSRSNRYVNNSSEEYDKSNNRSNSYNKRNKEHRQGRGKGSGTEAQREGAQHNPWLKHVAKVRQSRQAQGLSQPEILKMAKESYNQKGGYSCSCRQTGGYGCSCRQGGNY